ncbi:hypothetical protein Q8W71_24120 [Methylobacterium sp. NEAU 140]|uniref:hypothetical protein n=1 Tax=Methylobacterium sp. NEAU 140 TaxID=3064945 RepID=UPI00273709C0|nr:hypothetical protein [Methylobacterium sp. NEAU 140]MDP4025726.1 hypothetical protein [Methylobacterium sp. NEAU 140]
MNGTLGRVCLAALTCFAMAGAASARDADPGFKGKGFGKSAGKGAGKMAMPHYSANTRVSGPQQPYDWPVSDRYRPVSKPYYGRSF